MLIRMGKVSFLILGLTLGMLLTGLVTSGQTSKQLVFGYSAPGLGDEGQQNIQDGFVEKAQEMGIKVITTNAERSAAKQVSDIEDLIAKGVDAICAVPFDSQAISVAVKEANKAGIPFFTIDRGVAEGQLVLSVMADNYLAGQHAAEAMLRLLQGKYNGASKGKILEIMGQPGQDVTQLRGAGFEDYLSQYPDIQIIKKPGNWDPEKGYEITQDVLTANPDIDGIYYQADLYIPGVVEGIRAVKGSYAKVGEPGHIFILGVDGNPSGLANVRAGNADGVVVQPLRDYGHLIVPLIVKYVKEGPSSLPAPGTVLSEEGAAWSPATAVMTPGGLRVLTRTFYVDQIAARDCNLWGNRNADICKGK